MRRILTSAIFAVAALLPCQALAANTWGTDFSDLWWNPDESGWGVNIAHQGDVIFMTLFVYGEDNRVKWYVGSALTAQAGTDPVAFDGTLYETTGPYLGTWFNPAEVTSRQAGLATIRFLSSTEALLSYDVDRTFNTKRIERQTFRSNDLSGYYLGATIGTHSNCAQSSGSFANVSNFAVSHVGPSITIESSSNGVAGCTYSGSYSQHGRMGSITGSVSCPNGQVGTFAASEAEAGHQSLAARYTVHFSDGCTEVGRMGGLKQG